MADGRHLEKSKNVVLMDIINSLLKTGNKTANINVKNCERRRIENGKNHKKAMLTLTLTLTFRLCSCGYHCLFMIFAVFDLSPLTVYINFSFFTFIVDIFSIKSYKSLGYHAAFSA